jgi:hypothetical protein
MESSTTSSKDEEQNSTHLDTRRSQDDLSTLKKYIDRLVNNSNALTRQKDMVKNSVLKYEPWFYKSRDKLAKFPELIKTLEETHQLKVKKLKKAIRLQVKEIIFLQGQLSSQSCEITSSPQEIKK